MTGQTYEQLIDGEIATQTAAATEAAATEPAPAESVNENDTAPATEPVPAAPTSEPELSFDELLAHFDQETAQPEQPAQPAVDWEGISQAQQWRADQAEERARQVEMAAIAERDRTDALAAIKEIRGNLPVQDAAIGFWMDAVLQQNPEILQAWHGRHSNPAAFVQAKNMLARAAHQTFSRLPDPDASSDRAAVVASLRGASSDAPPPSPPINWGNLSDQEFRAKVLELGFSAGV